MRTEGRFQPSRIDRYLLGEVAGPFVGGMLFFTFLFLMFQLLRLAEFFIIHGVPLSIIGKLTGLMIIQFLPNALPIAFLIAVLVGFGRLSADSELVALKASGVGILRLSAPVAAVAVVIVALSLILNLEWAPWAEKTAKLTIIKVSNTKVVSSIKEGTFTSGFFDLLIFAEKVDRKSNKMSRVFIYDEREPKNPLTVVARTGEIVSVKTGGELGAAAMLKLYNGSIHRNDVGANSYSKIDFGEYRLWLKVNEGESQLFENESMIPYDDLIQRIHSHPPTTTENWHYRAELWRRIGIALAPILFVFLGVGFGTVRTRAIRASAMLIAFLTFTTYYMILVWGLNEMHKGTINPELSMLLPDLAILVVGIIAFRRAAW